MIYISASQNDYQNKSYSLQESIEFCTQAYLPLKEEVLFLLGDEGDQILKYCGGLEEYSYFYSRGDSLFAQLHDLRFELKPNSIVLEQAHLDPKIVCHFYQEARQTQIHSDFLRLQDSQQIYGLYYMTNKAYHKLWSISSGQDLRANHFSWQNLHMDLCINPTLETSNSYTKELL